MCVAIPGKIIAINGDIARINIMENITEANIRLVTAQIGDYVLVHAGCVLEVLKKDAAEEILSMFEEISESYSVPNQEALVTDENSSKKQEDI